MVIKIHTPLSDATPADVGAGLNNEMTVNPADLLAALLATGPGTPNALQQAIQALVAPPSTSPSFATPAETIAGTSTTTIVNPADLTAKLANQPASGACADREDVVWNGTILQGAAKHYSFSGSFPSIYFSVATGVAVPAGVVATQSVTIANPSACRTLRVTFDSSAGASSPNLTTTIGTNIISQVKIGGTAYLTNLGQELLPPIGPVFVMGTGILSKSYYDLAPGASQVIDYNLTVSGTPLVFNQTGQIRAFVVYSAQTI